MLTTRRGKNSALRIIWVFEVGNEDTFTILSDNVKFPKPALHGSAARSRLGFRRGREFNCVADNVPCAFGPGQIQDS